MGLKERIFGTTYTPRPGGWTERISGAAYTPPSGVRIAFSYQVVTEEFTLRGTEFQFSGFNGSYVQQHGSSGRRHPLRILLSGDDHDIQADVFRAAFQESGIGSLELPLKEPVDVVPLGDVKISQDYVSRSNETAFEVVFFETTGLAYLTRQDDAASAASVALEKFGNDQALDFSQAVDLGSVAEKASFKETLKNVLKQVKSTTGKIAAVQQNIKDEFDDALDLVDETIDVLIKDPLTLAFETQRIIALPSQAITSIGARLDGYSDLSQSMFNFPTATPGGPGGLGPHPGRFTGTGNDAQPTNNFALYKLTAANSIAGMVSSTLFTSTTAGTAGQLPAVSQSNADALDLGSDTGDSSFSTADQAITAAEVLLDQLAIYATWSDTNYTAINGTDIIPTGVNTEEGDSTEALRRAVALGAGYLIQLSFSLARGRNYRTDGPRNVIELCAELYGTIDENTLNFFIGSNGFTGDEIIEIPTGKDVVFYSV